MNGSARATSQKRRRSLRAKLLLVVMLATCAALVLSAAAILVYELRVYRAAWVSDLRSQADLVAQSVAPTLDFDDPKSAHEALAVLKLRPGIRAAAVYDDGDKVFATYRADAQARPSWPPQPRPAGVTFSTYELELFQPVRHGGAPIGTVYLRARHDLLGRMFDYLLIAGFAIAGGLLLAGLIFRQLHPAITRPILAVAQVSRRVMEERNYDLRVDEKSDDEVGDLVEAFNNMLRDLAVEMRERAAAEAALRAADRRKDVFLATLAHELRNPLAPLSNALALLRRADADPVLRERMMAMMERQLRQLVRLIDDLLEVSRITRGKLELRRATVDLVAIAHGAVEAAEPMLCEKQHTLRTELPAGPVWVHADAARLTQVFVNLLHNAAKYTPPHGRVALVLTPHGDAAEVAVIDNGVGIDAADQATIFDMFVQVDQSLERGAAGLGVGLTIARQLVEMHGGSLSVHSAGKGEGARFTVRMPTVAAPAHTARGTVVSASAHAAPALDVLVADDNVDFANSFAQLLRCEGHRVTVTHDGQAALSAAGAAPFHIAFLDIGMPSLNGYELAQRLRAEPRTQQLMLVAVTGWGQEADRERVRQAGFDHHLVKPVAPEQALAVLAQAREGSGAPAGAQHGGLLEH